ncbi:hypothetical protein [Deinococcus sp. Leaf326]|uniref:hypothetical protein n=1 Tax=Deinococcus sp. Leaf326 TaxID=1736338 RepID=UPI0006FEBB4F|nr:hypothetical protein [Deinococcus sp. Leaf326]KQR25674.1 hypothetical protein ASF71_18485 [Deinococcus sp. Leaf326]
MPFLVVSATTPDAPQAWSSHLDYPEALARYREQERALVASGFVLLADCPTYISDFETYAQLLSPDHILVLRSALGEAYAQPYLKHVEIHCPLNQTGFAQLNRQKYLLLALLSGQTLSPVELDAIGGLVSLLDTLQDHASDQGVPQGIVWPNVPFGQAVDEEARLWAEQPDVARVLVGQVYAEPPT